MEDNFQKDPSSLPPVSITGALRYSKTKGWIGGKETMYIPQEEFHELTYNKILSRYHAKVDYCIKLCQARLIKMGIVGVTKDHVLRKLRDQWASYKVTFLSML